MNTSTSISSTNISPEYSDEIDYISEIQPSIHENKKSCCEYFLKHIFLIPNRDITQNEYSKQNILRKECITVFDDEPFIKSNFNPTYPTTPTFNLYYNKMYRM